VPDNSGILNMIYWNLNPAVVNFGVSFLAYLPEMQGINGADVVTYFNPLITKQIR